MDTNGLYYLCEKIGAEKGKIDLGSSSPNTPADSCGFLLESYFKLDKDRQTASFPSNYYKTDILNNTGKGINAGFIGWEVKEPEEYTETQFEYIRNYHTLLETLIRDSLDTGRYRDYFDIESAVNWWLVQEVCSNEEASRTKNVYLYKPSGGNKLMMGPPWDFDA